MKKFRTLATLSSTLVLLITVNGTASAQYNGKFMEERSVRVTAEPRGGKPRASSGFLWLKPDQVVTSLHAVPAGSKITVECRGAKSTATVLKTLAKADLILLKAPDLPARCQPFTSYERQKPAPFSTLYTFGYHAGVKSGTARRFAKGHANPERLDTLISGVPLQAIRAMGMPATNLDIYYVQGGLLPGYSGGPVVDDKMRLVGIVDGGLNKGTSSYNWVVPAKYLDELVDSRSNTIPRQVAQRSDQHFSSGIYETDARSVVEYVEDGRSYSWVLTKTQSAAELKLTADAAQGLDQLFADFGDTAGVQAADEVIFDVYEELDLGLIIAVPEGQPLTYETIEDEGDWLLSQNASEAGGFSGIRFAHASIEVRDEFDQIVLPSAANYFSHFIAERVAECHDPGITYCELDSEAIQMISYGGSNKLVRFGIVTLDYQESILSYDYYVIAARGDDPFGAQARIVPDGDSGLIQCLVQEAQACENTSAARQQLMQLLAAHMTSFSGLANDPNQQIEQIPFSYDNSWDDPSTVFVPYLEGEQMKFFNTRGKLWRVYHGDEYYDATEYERDDNGNVLLQYGDIYLSVPIDGGQYFQSTINGGWTPIGTVQPLRENTYVTYLEGTSVRFQYYGGSEWQINVDEVLYDSAEIRRDPATNEVGERAVLQYGDVYYSVPLDGGQYWRSTASGEWEIAGTIEVQLAQ